MKTIVICLITNNRYKVFINDFINHYLNELQFDHILFGICLDEDIDVQINDKISVQKIQDGKQTYNFQYTEQQISFVNQLIESIEKDYDYCICVDIFDFVELNKDQTISDFIQHNIIDKGEKLTEIPLLLMDDSELLFEDPDRSYKENYIFESLKNNNKHKSIFYTFKNEEGSGVRFRYNNSNKFWPIENTLRGGFTCSKHLSSNIAVIRSYQGIALENYIKQISETNNNSDDRNIVKDFFTLNSVSRNKMNLFPIFCSKYHLDLNVNEINSLNMLKETYEVLN